MRNKDEFSREFFDELLGMAVRQDPRADEAARGLFIRERMEKVRQVISRMYTFLAEEKPVVPVKNGTQLPQRKP